MEKGKKIILLFFMLLFLNSVYSMTIINSSDWKFNYISAFDSTKKGEDFYFVLSPNDTEFLINATPKTGITLVTDAENPIIPNLLNVLLTSGKEVIEIQYNGYYDLQKKKISEYQGALFLEKSNPSKALLSLNYACNKDYLPFFIQTSELNDISEINKGIAVGSFNTSIQEIFIKNNIKLINELTNIKDSEKLIEGNIDTITLINDRYLEKTMFTNACNNKIIIISPFESASSELMNFIKNYNIKYVEAIGSEWMAVGEKIRTDSNKEVVVVAKWMIGISSGGKIEQQPLRRFEINVVNLKINIGEVSYNIPSKQLIVEYQNDEKVSGFLSSVIEIYNNNQKITNLSDSSPFYIADEEKIIRLYDNIELDPTKKYTAKLYTLYGVDKGSMSTYAYDVGSIPPIERDVLFDEIIDLSDIEIKSFVYDFSKKEFLIDIENIKDKDVYVKLTIENFYRDGLEDIVVSDIEKIEASLTKTIHIKKILTTIDLQDNEGVNVNVVAKYGENKDILINEKEKEFAFLNKKEDNFNFYFLLLIVVLLIVLFIVKFTKKKKEDKITKKKKEEKKESANNEKTNNQTK